MTYFAYPDEFGHGGRYARREDPEHDDSPVSRPADFVPEANAHSPCAAHTVPQRREHPRQIMPALRRTRRSSSQRA